MRAWHALAVGASGLCVVACGCAASADGDACAAPPALRPTPAALIGGSPDSALLSPAQLNAVAALLSDVKSGQAGLCSGVLVSPLLLLTARHCQEQLGNEAVARFGAAISDSMLDVAVAHFEPHTDYDFALAVLAERVPASIARPLPLLSEPPTQGTPGTLAGFGLDETDAIGERRFVLEPITQVDAGFITVDGSGRSGACVGDSGGPLLLPDAGGEQAVAGVLSRGSASCTGVDLYQRADLIGDWLDAIQQAYPAPPALDDCAAPSP